MEATTNPLPGLEVRDGGRHYGIYDHGAHAWAWQPEGAEPVLWLSEKSIREPGRPIRGGVPVCFPWFGAGRNGGLQPGHGFARLHGWRRVRGEDAAEGAVAVYELDDTLTGEQPNWPHRYHAELTVRFGATELVLELRVRNTGSEEFTYEEALHTYLAVGDIREATVTGLEEATYFDKVTGDRKTQAGAITFTTETDRLFRSTGTVVLNDPVLGRTLTVTKENSANTIVWNPWAEKAAAMPDFGDDEWLSMVCIEAGNAVENAITLRPGEEHRLTQRIALGRDDLHPS